MKKHLVGCVLLSLAIMGGSAMRHSLATNPSTPLMYYYDENEGAFIIERADGGDRKQLVAYQLPDAPYGGRNFVAGPGWSPSGKWFAWTVDNIDGACPTLHERMYFVDSDGERFFSVPINPDPPGVCVSYAEWSPGDDLLLASYGVQTPQTFLIDPRSQDVTMMTTPPRMREVARQWSPTGQHIVTLYSDFSITTPNIFRMRVIGLDGQFEERTIKSADDCSVTDCPFWSGDGKVAYVDSTSGQLVIENFSTHDQVALDISNAFLKWVDWNPDDAHAFVYVASEPDAEYFDSYLLSTADRTLTSVVNQAILPRRFSSAVDRNFKYRLYPIGAWSPSGESGVVFSNDGTLHAIELSPFRQTQKQIPIRGTITMIQWSKDSERIFFSVNPFWGESEEAAIVRYDFETGEMAVLILSSSDIRQFSLSNSGNILAYTIGQDGHLLDLRSGQETEVVFIVDVFRESSGYLEGGRVDEFLWHPSENWAFILLDDTNDSRLVNVIDTEGTIQRELGLCHFSPSCFGWLLPSGAN